ncbi:hypothetical protein CHS0354_010610 [Potamilus streckersoni]|uniref:Uncharacterized protein n=1 Tax=Potamilus streckersoni TaxID=2493646 RepID=A0AAE0SGG3_9BIVA|nr:hypothetical protein CHS0354_010610 [Potamilus streckersoni]
MEQRQNRKLLEQLEEQKKRLRGIPTHHGSVLSNATTPGAAAVISSVAVPLPPQINPISSTVSITVMLMPIQWASLSPRTPPLAT